MNIVFSLPPALIIGLIVTVVLPLIVGLITNANISASWKSVILALLAAATGLGTELLAAVQSGSQYDLGNGVILALTSFLIAVGLHFGIYKPTGAASALQAVGAGTKESPAIITTLPETDPTPAIDYEAKHVTDPTSTPPASTPPTV